MILSIKPARPLICAAIFALSLSVAGCRRTPDETQETIPALNCEAEPIAQISAPAAARARQTSQNGSDALNNALRAAVSPPDALETRLQKEERIIWKDVLRNIEACGLERKDAMIMSALIIPRAEACEPPVSAFSLRQQSQIQLTLQMRRNVLWRLGRLEMATNGVFHALQNFVAQFRNDHVKGAKETIVDPIKSMARQIGDLRKNQPKPDGNWNPGELAPRMARTAAGAPIFLQARDSFAEWQRDAAQSAQYEYLADSAAPVIAALDAWIDEYGGVIKAIRELAQSIRDLERVFSPPHAFVAYPCIGNNLRRLRALSQIYAHVLAMQWNLTQARNGAQTVLRAVRSDAYAAAQNEFIAGEISGFREKLAVQKDNLTRAEDILLHDWDDTSKIVWSSLQVFVDPIHHHMLPAVENAHIWQEMYKHIVAELNALLPKIAAEPQQPLNRRGKPHPAFIHSVTDMLRAPARIDEVERSLLAISELEAHMRAVRDELLRLCKQGGCKGFPEAEISNSPRRSAWVVSWRQSPSQERTLGHSLVVIELCRRHLSRLVQRLTEIYAWFAETSNADLTWKKLKSWQRIWTLYAEPNGTYATFLQSIADLSYNVAMLSKPHKTLAQSPALIELLRLQSLFFDITVDYARFIDTKTPPPVSFDELISTWETLDAALIKIQTLTDERDAAAGDQT